LKLVFCRLFERTKLVNACVVYENIEPAECFLSLSEKMFDIFRFRNISLDRDRLSAFVGNFTYDLFGTFL